MGKKLKNEFDLYRRWQERTQGTYLGASFIAMILLGSLGTLLGVDNSPWLRFALIPLGLFLGPIVTFGFARKFGSFKEN